MCPYAFILRDFRYVDEWFIRSDAPPISGLVKPRLHLAHGFAVTACTTVSAATRSMLWGLQPAI